MRGVIKGGLELFKNSYVLVGWDFPKGSYRDLAAEMQTLFRKVGYNIKKEKERSNFEENGGRRLRGQELKYEITGFVI